jgi:hypothetical protein
MEYKMEMRGMRQLDIVDYFREVNSEVGPAGFFDNRVWQVKVSDEKTVRYGSIVLTSTSVVFYGKRENVEHEVQKFRQRFMKAGG